MAAATITSSVALVIGNNLPITFSNPSGRYLQISIQAGNSLEASVAVRAPQNIGNVGSYSVVFTSPEIAALYNGFDTTGGAPKIFVNVGSYTSAAYTTHDGSDQLKNGALSLNTATEKPSGFDFTIANVDKSIPVTDKYGNVLVTSSTSTLMGADTRMIRGYSKVRATMTNGNRGTAPNGATVKGARHTATRLNSGVVSELTVSSDFVGTNTWTADIDNAYANSFAVRTYSNRSIDADATTKTLSLLDEYDDVAISGLGLARDNSVDALTTLSFSGTFWKKYFGSNDASSAVGTLNTLTTEYRFKRSDVAWASLDGTFTITIASPGVATKTAHGFNTGDVIYLTTTGALPTGLAANTNYWVIRVTADTFRLATSSANATAGTAINTTGSQSGVHTIHGNSIWATISPSTISGNISFSAHANGDLGASGFSTSKSFTVEVRCYDKLSQMIIEANLSVGIPLIHKTPAGVAFNQLYDTTKGGSIQIGSPTSDGGIVVIIGAATGDEGAQINMYGSGSNVLIMIDRFQQDMRFFRADATAAHSSIVLGQQFSSGGKFKVGINSTAPSSALNIGATGVAAAAGALTFDEESVTPSNPSQDNQVRMYLKADKLVIQFNNAATVRYKYLDLTGTTVTWIHTTTAP